MQILSKIHLILVSILVSFVVQAQEVSNFTITSVDSIDYTLYDYLDTGTPVVLDMFARYCGTCSDHMPFVDTLWLDYGSGENVQVWAIETSGYHDTIVSKYKEDHLVSFPFFSTQTNMNFLDSFPFSYTPWYYVICSDRSLRHVEYENLRSYINACSSVSISNKILNSNIVYYLESEIIFKQVEFVGQLNFSVYSLSGQKIMYRTVESWGRELKIPIELNKGFYILELVDSQNKRLIRKIKI